VGNPWATVGEVAQRADSGTELKYKEVVGVGSLDSTPIMVWEI
jgi:hypothetical protein